MVSLFYESRPDSVQNFINLSDNCTDKCSKTFDVVKYYPVYSDPEKTTQAGDLLLVFYYGKISNSNYFYTGNYTIMLPDGNIFVPFSKANGNKLHECFQTTKIFKTELLGIGQSGQFIGQNFRVTFEYADFFQRRINIEPLS